MVDRIEVWELLERQVLMRASRKTRQGIGGSDKARWGLLRASKRVKSGISKKSSDTALIK